MHLAWLTPQNMPLPYALARRICGRSIVYVKGIRHKKRGTPKIGERWGTPPLGTGARINP